MKKLTALLFAAAVAGLSVSADAFTFEKSKLSLSVMPGMAVPVSGDWADSTLGYKSAISLGVAGDYKLDEMLSAGLELGYDFGHKNEAVSDLKVKVISLTPFLKATKKIDLINYYGVFGLGLYHSSNNC